MAKEIKQWITINGKHIPIFEGESKEDAVKRVTNKKDDKQDKKEKEDFGGEYNGKRLTEKEMDEVIEKEYDPDAARRAQIDALKKRAQEKQEEKKTDDDFMEKENQRWKKEFGNEDAYQWSDGKKKSVEVDQDELMDIVDKYNATSKPVSGSWDTETEHEQKTIADHFGISMDEAKHVMKEQLGFDDDMFPAKEQKSGNDKNREYFEQAKKEGRVDKDAEYEDFVNYAPIKDDPNYTKKRIARETADENDAYDRAHGEGKYEKANLNDMSYSQAGAYVADHRKEFGLSDKDDAYLVAAQIKNGDIKLDSDGKVSKGSLKKNRDWAESKNKETMGGRTNKKELAGTERNMPIRSQEQVGKYDKYKQGRAYDNAKEVNVNGNTYKVWSDQNYKGTFAEDKDGNVLPISGSGYLSNELSQRKAIANKFGEPSFRSKSIKIGNKEVGVTKAKSVRDIVGNDKNSEWKLSKAYDRTSLKNIALDAGISSKRVNSMTIAELREMLLSMWKKG